MCIFIILAATEFITGTNWGMYVIALPIVIPLAKELGVHMPLAVAACGCDNYRHAISKLPYGLISALFSLIGFGILGFYLA